MLYNANLPVSKFKESSLLNMGGCVCVLVVVGNCCLSDLPQFEPDCCLPMRQYVFYLADLLQFCTDQLEPNTDLS